MLYVWYQIKEKGFKSNKVLNLVVVTVKYDMPNRPMMTHALYRSCTEAWQIKENWLKFYTCQKKMFIFHDDWKATEQANVFILRFIVEQRQMRAKREVPVTYEERSVKQCNAPPSSVIRALHSPCCSLCNWQKRRKGYACSEGYVAGCSFPKKINTCMRHA